MDKQAISLRELERGLEYHQVVFMNRVISIANLVSEQAGETVLWPLQIRIAAYLLGYEDELHPDHSFGVSNDTYRFEIEPLIPEEAKVNFSDFPELRKHGLETILQNPVYGKYGFKSSGVIKAFETLHEQGKLQYVADVFEHFGSGEES